MRGGKGCGLRRKPQTWLRDCPIGHENVDFVAPASVMRTLADQIGHRHEKLVNGGDKRWVQGAALRRIKQTGRRSRSRGRWVSGDGKLGEVGGPDAEVARLCAMASRPRLQRLRHKFPLGRREIPYGPRSDNRRWQLDEGLLVRLLGPHEESSGTREERSSAWSPGTGRHHSSGPSLSWLTCPHQIQKKAPALPSTRSRSLPLMIEMNSLPNAHAPASPSTLRFKQRTVRSGISLVETSYIIGSFPLSWATR